MGITGIQSIVLIQSTKSAITSGLLIAIRSFGGTIGLAVCKDILHSFHGHINP
jgi:hypothetical protein